jgi:endonuclease/exonuclease/phosphatase family metal-dependent hydrolase
MRLRVVTYNIHGGKGKDGKIDFKRIGELLKKIDTDIALIQELDTRFEDRSTEKDIEDLQCDHFTYFEAAPTMKGQYGWYGNAILSKLPILRSSIIDISLMQSEPRNIQEAFIKIPNGELQVVNTHKGLRPSERSIQFAHLHKLLIRESETPLIVGGDLNEWAILANPIKKMNEVLHPILPGPTFPTFFPFLHLDRMWCRPHSLFRRAQVVKTPETRIYSDHFPILAEIEL